MLAIICYTARASTLADPSNVNFTRLCQNPELLAAQKRENFTSPFLTFPANGARYEDRCVAGDTGGRGAHCAHA
jgi:hypothetical protein